MTEAELKQKLKDFGEQLDRLGYSAAAKDHRCRGARLFAMFLAGRTWVKNDIPADWKDCC